MFWPRTPPRCWCAARRRSTATPSRPHRRAPRYEPHRTLPSTPVDYACLHHAPRPNHGPNRPLGRRFGPLRSRAAAEQGVPASRAAPTRPIRPGRPISDGRSRLDRRSPLPCALRSRSSGQKPRITVRPGLIAKEPLHFLLFNPQSDLIQKYLRRGPVLFT